MTPVGELDLATSEPLERTNAITSSYPVRKMNAVGYPQSIRETGAPLTTRRVDVSELVFRWREHGDRAARDEVFARFHPLARRLAGRYANPYEPVSDLIQVASVGLLGAIDRFDPSRGTAFSTFAVPTILGELKRYLRATAWSVHVTRGAQELALRLDQAASEISARTGRPPRVAELADYLALTVEDVLEGLEISGARHSLSLDAPASGPDVDEPRCLGDSLGELDNRFELVEAKLSLRGAIARLPRLEGQALTLRIEDDMKQRDIAARLGCSQMHVSRLLRRASHGLRALIGPDLSADRAPASTEPASV
ncbi:MAG TPA: sigma-70 family RNA polymerase sigma factor [Solirubrobacteraceae bacterium]|nr:sigma-70 family RNA polymerase sigma factor [Solirubrobacteraceae bacterium]